MDYAQIILSIVLPTITGFGGAITSILVCISKVKSIASSAAKENILLKKQLAEAKEKSNQLEGEVAEAISETKEMLKEKEQECKSLVQENVSLKEIISAISTIKDVQETIKNQITVLLSEKGE